MTLLLANAGVVDTGGVLHNAVEYGLEKAIIIIAQQRGMNRSVPIRV